MGGEERKKRRAERGGEVRLPHSKFLDPPLTAERGEIRCVKDRQLWSGQCCVGSFCVDDTSTPTQHSSIAKLFHITQTK